MKKAEAGARHVIRHCGDARPGERIVIIGAEEAPEAPRLLEAAARQVSQDVVLILQPQSAMHGAEPIPEAAKAMLAADLAIGATPMSLAHTAARLAASRAGARYLSLPEYSPMVLALDDLFVNYRAMHPAVRRVTDRLTACSNLVARSANGTEVFMDATGRVGNCCPGYVAQGGTLGSPPDIESNISPLESRSHGRIVVDGSIAHPTIGVLETPVTLEIENGAIVDWRGPESAIRALEALFGAAGSPKARILAECGVGMNPKAQLRGVMLTDEGCAGALHFGFGSNASVGGENAVSFHLDFCMRDASLIADGEPILTDGVFADWVGFDPGLAELEEREGGL